MTVTFQDGEPVDPKKLQDLQNQIDAIQLQTNETYNLSETTANNVKRLSIFHIASGEIEFANGLVGGKVTPLPIDLGWDNSYEVAYVVATPRGNDPKKNNLRWSISGSGTGTTVLNVYAEKTITGSVKFHWISAGKKNLTK